LVIIEGKKGVASIEQSIESSVGLQTKASTVYLSLGIAPNYHYYGQKDKRYIGKDNFYYYSLASLNVMGLGNIIGKLNLPFYIEQGGYSSYTLYAIYKRDPVRVTSAILHTISNISFTSFASSCLFCASKV
jgi:hypothetical protein